MLFLLVFYIIGTVSVGLFFPKPLQLNINYALGKHGHLNSKIKEIPLHQNTDILFLGSSHCYRGFDVRIFEKAGFCSFNLGSSSQSHLQTNVLLKRYLNQIQPNTIIYEVYPNIFEIDGVESTLDLIANDNNYDYLWKLIVEHQHLKVFNSFIYGAFRKIVGLDKDYVEPTVRGKDKYISGGFVERKTSEFNAYFKPSSKPIEYKQNQLKAFEENIKLILSKKIELILIQAPVTRAYYSSIVQPQKHDALMENYSPYYNFNDRVELVDSLHFYDYHHLNQTGVEIFNQAVLDQLLLQQKEIR